MEDSPLAGGFERLFEDWKTEIHDKSEEVDPHEERSWEDINLGWCLAKGLSLVTARAFYDYCVQNGAW